MKGDLNMNEKNLYLFTMIISYIFVLVCAYHSSKSIIVTLGVGIIAIIGAVIVYKVFNKLR